MAGVQYHTTEYNTEYKDEKLLVTVYEPWSNLCLGGQDIDVARRSSRM